MLGPADGRASGGPHRPQPVCPGEPHGAEEDGGNNACDSFVERVAHDQHQQPARDQADAADQQEPLSPRVAGRRRAGITLLPAQPQVAGRAGGHEQQAAQTHPRHHAQPDHEHQQQVVQHPERDGHHDGQLVLRRQPVAQPLLGGGVRKDAALAEDAERKEDRAACGVVLEVAAGQIVEVVQSHG